jgi:antitoxin component YwqK of YwqJK toxin-antitoxin module
MTLRIKHSFLALLLATSLAPAAQDPAFYDNKRLAHPMIAASQDSGADIAFVREANGVNGYYCLCTGAEGKPESEPHNKAKARKLDSFGQADIRSVFYVALDRDPAPEHQTLLVLLRTGGKPGLRAYRYHESSGSYRRLVALQPALDRITDAGGTLNAARVKAALGQLAPLDYSVERGNSGNPDFDAIDHTGGTVMGYYTLDGQPTAADSKQAAIYKKVFKKQGQRFLTASYTLYSDIGAGELPNYRLWQLTWETAPQQFDGNAQGPSVLYSLAWDDHSVVERGQYTAGKRSGMWVRSGMHEGDTKGAYVNGLPDGPWHYEGPRYSEDGVYRNGQREGRWAVTNYAAEDEVTGFDTYAGGQLNGPQERTMGGKLLSRGSYINGSRQGPWITDEGRGAYVDGMRDGPWTLSYSDGDVATTMHATFVKGKKHGEVTAYYANGAARLRDHYNMDVLDGARSRYAVNGAVLYSAMYSNGQLDGREQAFDNTGKILRMDTHWAMGKKQGLDSRFYANGKPERLAEIERGQLVVYLREYAEDGQLINDIRRCFFTEYDRERNDVCDYHRMFFANGKPQYDYVFQFGERQEGRSWYENGKLKDELLIDRVRDTSVWNTYFDSGQLKCTEPRKGHGKRTVNGQQLLSYGSANRDGDSICYHPNGQMASIRSYRNRLAVDCGKQFDDTGKQTSPGPEGCPPKPKPHFIFGE